MLENLSRLLSWSFYFSTGCGGFIELNDNDPPGYITSPNYPQNYPQNIDCIWVITVPNGEAVQIDFEDQFYIEPTSRYTFTFSSGCCIYTFLLPRKYSNCCHFIVFIPRLLVNTFKPIYVFTKETKLKNKQTLQCY